MTIDQREILARALDLIGYGSLSKDIASGGRALIPSVAALAAMDEVERRVREESAVEQKSLRDACLLARNTFTRYADYQKVKGTPKADQNAKHYRWMAELMRDAMNGFNSPTLVDTVLDEVFNYDASHENCCSGKNTPDDDIEWLREAWCTELVRATWKGSSQ
jgi:hypothetical protein